MLPAEDSPLSDDAESAEEYAEATGALDMPEQLLDELLDIVDGKAECEEFEDPLDELRLQLLSALCLTYTSLKTSTTTEQQREHQSSLTHLETQDKLGRLDLQNSKSHKL